ncbi:MAG: NUDIX domain-containing protein [Defluviitaleaceae bacterium]|nr:NUDIX domain-containing protein [Defluviitaleaceae bacterium]
MHSNINVFGVAAKGFVIKDYKLLILYKTKEEATNDPNPNIRIDTPGGRVEFGEAPDISLMREIKEECSIRAKILFPFNVWHYINENFQLVGIDYLCEWIDGDVVLGKEHENFEWISLDEILNREWDNKDIYIRVFDIYEKYISK